MDKQILYYVVLVLGSLTTRTDLVRLMAGTGAEVLKSSKFKYYFGILAGIAFTSVVIWGFINLKWYVALASFILISLVLSSVVNRSTINTFVTLKLPLEVLTVTLAIIIWVL